MSNVINGLRSAFAPPVLQWAIWEEIFGSIDSLVWCTLILRYVISAIESGSQIARMVPVLWGVMGALCLAATFLHIAPQVKALEVKRYISDYLIPECEEAVQRLNATLTSLQHIVITSP